MTDKLKLLNKSVASAARKIENIQVASIKDKTLDPLEPTLS
jgi:hypothetical protein